MSEDLRTIAILAAMTLVACGEPGAGTGAGTESGNGSTGETTGAPTMTDGSADGPTDGLDGGSDTMGAVSEPFDVVVEDGSASLSFPAGALPPGVAPSDIAIERLDPDAVFTDVEGSEVVALYELSPDGLQLLQPATFRLAMSDQAGWQMLFHTSRSMGSVESPELELTVDGGGSLWGEAQLEHFSRIRLDLAENLGVRVQVPLSDSWVGMSTLTQINVFIPHMATYRSVWEEQDGEYSQRTEIDADTWAFSGTFFQFDALAPSRIDNPPAPAPGRYNDDDPAPSVRQRLTCARPGPGESGFLAVADLPAVTVGTAPDGKTTSYDSPVEHSDESITQAITCLALPQDPPDDHIDSTAETAVAYTNAAIDLTGFAGGILLAADTSPDESQDKFGLGGLLGCGTADEETEVVCPADSEPMPADADVLVYAAKVAGPLQLDDPTRRFQYAVVVDSDGDPANDWQYQDPFVNDFFQGADRWYVAEWSALGWTLTVSSVDAAQNVTTVPSTARVAVFEDSLMFYISASEMAQAEPGYRLTAYGDDGAYTLSERGGDVSGDFPVLSTGYDTLAVATSAKG